MKKLVVILLAFTVLAVGIWGCRGKPQLNTDKVDFAFAASETAERKPLDEAIKAFQERKPQDALVGLQKLMEDKVVSDEQKEAVKDLIDQINTYLGKPVTAAKPK